VTGTGDKTYSLWFSKVSTEKYWNSVEVKKSSAFHISDYGKLVFKFKKSDDLFIEKKPLGKIGQYGSGPYFYNIQAIFSPEHFTSLTNEGDILVELSKVNELKDSFVVSKNFQKLLKTFF